MVPNTDEMSELDGILSEDRGEVVVRSSSGREVVLSGSARAAVEEVVREMARGNSVRVIPVEAEVSTQRAADILNVSRPHVVKMIERGDIPFRKVGSHRRVVLADLLSYKKRRDGERGEALDEMARISDDLGLYGE